MYNKTPDQRTPIYNGQFLLVPMVSAAALEGLLYMYRKSLNRSPPQIDAGLKLTPGVKLSIVQ